MKIGLDASRYQHESPTGVEVYSKAILEGLVARGADSKHEIVLYTPRLIENFPAACQRIIPGHRLWTQWHLRRELSQNPPNVFFVPSHVLPLGALPQSVIMIHDVAFEHFPKAYSFFQRFYLRFTTHFAAKYAAKILVPSKSTADDLTTHFSVTRSKIEVIPHGFSVSPVDSEQKNCSILPTLGLKNSPYFLFVGRLETKKNLVRLVKAFHEFQRKHPEWKLVLAGKRGQGFKFLLKTVERLELLQTVIMPGYVTDVEKRSLMKEARGFVFPSLAEGFGFPILEASAHELPVLASDLSVFSEFKSLIEVSCDPHSVDSMVTGLQQLASIKRGSKKQALSRFSWEKSIDQTWKVLTHLTPSA